jgi:hypothetical protein
LYLDGFSGRLVAGGEPHLLKSRVFATHQCRCSALRS